MFTSRDMSVEDFEKKMLGNGWIKRRIETKESYKYFYYKYVKPGKMAVSPLFHADAPNTYWVKEISR